MNDTANSQPRLREHPVSRFDGEQHLFDFNDLAQQLHNEPHAATDGHRQIALFHYGSVTTVFFAFEEGGTLEEHAANGVVSIQVISGAITVGAEGQTHELTAGKMLLLSPNVRHDLRASQTSQMLLMVHLHGQKHDDAPRRDSERDTTEVTP